MVPIAAPLNEKKDSSPEAPIDPPKYVGPSKFLDACKDGRWDLVQEWLNSRDYKQDKHRKSKINSKTDAALIPWNEAHHWLECLQLVCAGSSIELLELLIRYCEGRWVDQGSWLTQEEALLRGREAAVKAKNVNVVNYLEKNWITASVEPERSPNEKVDSPKKPDVTAEADKLELSVMSSQPTTWDLDKLVEELRSGRFDHIIPHICGAILQNDADTRMALSQLLLPTQLVTIALYAASKNWNSVVAKTLTYGLSAAQCARVATSIGDVRALECIVMNFGASWALYTREAVLYYINTRSTRMFDEFTSRGVTNWEGALIAAAEFSAPELIPRFLPSSRLEKRKLALQRAILNNRVEAAEVLGPHVHITDSDLQLAKTDEMRHVLRKYLVARPAVTRIEVSTVELGREKDEVRMDAFASARYT